MGFLSFLIPLRSIRVYILYWKQLLFSISMNLGVKKIYLSASRLSQYFATILPRF